MFPLVKTINTLKRPNLVGIMLLCAGLAVMVVLLGVGLVTWLTATYVNFERTWIDTVLNWTVTIVSGIGGWFMLPVLTVLIAGVFQETTIDRVERACYPARVRQEGPGFWPDLMHDIRFTLWALFLNILVLPFYLFGIGPFVSVALNSYLLGREFFESAAGYHLGKARAKALVPRHRRVVYGGGLVFTLLTLVPLVNFFVPIFAVVWMVHVYHGLIGEPARS